MITSAMADKARREIKQNHNWQECALLGVNSREQIKVTSNQITSI